MSDTKTMNIAWLDDQRQVFKSTIPSLTDEFKSKYDVELKFAEYRDHDQFNQDIKIKKDDVDAIFLDIDLNGNVNGIDVYNKLRQLDNEINVVFVSGHLNDPEYESQIEKLREADPNLHTIKLSFPTRRSKEYYNTVALPIINVINSNLGIYENKYDDFLKANNKKRIAMQKQVSKFDLPFVKNYFDKNPESDWIVMGDQPGIVLKEGNSNTLLNSRLLSNVSEEYGKMVTCFQRIGEKATDIISIIDNPSARDYLYQSAPDNIEIIYGKVIDITEEYVLMKCKSVSENEDAQIRKFDIEPLRISGLKTNSIIEIRILTYPGERRFLFRKAKDLSRKLFEKRKYFEEESFDKFFKLAPPSYEDNL